MHSQLASVRRVVMALIVTGLWQVLATDRVHAGINQWTSNGPGVGDVRALAIDPQTPTTLYAGTNGGGVFKSTDGGAHWSDMNTGLFNPNVRALAIDPQTPTTLYAGTDGSGVFSIQQVNLCDDGLVEGNEQYDLGAHNGQAGFCCSATCQFKAAATVCRAQAGVCDVAETCTGTSPFCPANTFKASTAVCRPSFGACDVAETCTGTSAFCPANTYKGSSVVCRPAAGACDVAESCSGTGPFCPANTFKASRVVCRPAVGACDVAETCTGTSPYCPANTFKASSVVCRPAARACDVAESCTGTSPRCPADHFQPDGTTCDDGNAATCNDQCTTGSCAGTAC